MLVRVGCFYVLFAMKILIKHNGRNNQWGGGDSQISEKGLQSQCRATHMGTDKILVRGDLSNVQKLAKKTPARCQ